MLMESWVKCSRNTSRVSGVNSIAAKSDTIEVKGDQFFKGNKTETNMKGLRTVPVVSSKCPEAPDIQIYFLA